MEFKDPQAIYEQIADYVCDQLQLGTWAAGGRLPSVRELAANLQVNPNTVARAYEQLEGLGIVLAKRGLGYFAADDAPGRIAAQRREAFLAHELPQFFRRLALLGIGWDEVAARYQAVLAKA
jgi:DNA-binding transcriptional regulator YhcF (GntR family)